MAEKIRFSIIIPAYNAEATIVSAIESCLRQSYPDFEIIVVDDGSSDSTKALVEARFGGLVRLISMPGNSGPSAARNAGIRLATGTHIAFQDADDEWHPEKLKAIAAVLEKNPNINFLFHPYTLAPLDFNVTSSQLVPERFPFWKLLLSNPIGTPCVVLERSKAGFFKEHLHHMEDYELFLRMAWLYSVYRIDAPFTRVGRPILSAGGQSSRRWKMRTGEIKAWWAFARFRPFFFPLVLPLSLFALLKHFIKSFFPPRTNY